MLLVDILLGGFQFGCEVKLTADGVDYRVPCGLRCDYDRMEESNKPRNCNHHFPCLFANRVLFSRMYDFIKLCAKFQRVLLTRIL